MVSCRGPTSRRPATSGPPEPSPGDRKGTDHPAKAPTFHDGQANAALCAYLAEAAGLRAPAARIRRGSGGARKLVEIDGEPAVIVARLLERFGAVADAGA